MKYWLLAFSCLLFLPNIYKRHLIKLPDNPVKQEDFDPLMARRVQNITSLEHIIDSTVRAKAGNSRIETEVYVDAVASTIRRRFFHSYSHYSLHENWMAALAGKFIWDDLSAIVIADHILKYPMAACSQQSIVLMEFFKRKKIPFRKISFDHHFAVEGKINGQWIYFDPNLEPEFHGTHRSFEYLRQGKRLQELYQYRIPPDAIPELLANPRYGKINAYPAQKARLLHYTLSTLSHTLWTIPLLLFGVNLWDKRNSGA